MNRAFLMGLVAGARAVVPLAAVSHAAAQGTVRPNLAIPGWLGRAPAPRALDVLAAAELLGDKLPLAPNRVSPAGLLARVVSGSVVGAALSSPRKALAGAALGALAAVGAAHLSFQLRMAALKRFGQTPTGLIEDALALLAARWILSGARER